MTSGCGRVAGAVEVEVKVVRTIGIFVFFIFIRTSSWNNLSNFFFIPSTVFFNELNRFLLTYDLSRLDVIFLDFKLFSVIVPTTSSSKSFSLL